MIDQKQLKKCYNTWALTYDKNARENPVIVKDHPIIIDLLKTMISPKDVGLDLGCGTGILTNKIAPFVKEIIGIDISEEMIVEARKNQKTNNIKYKIGNISQKLNFPDNSFDFIISSLTLCHIEDLESVYKEVYRILKKDGVFIFDEITSKLNKPFSPKYEDYLEKFGQQNRIWQRHTLDEHLKLIKNMGFKIEKVIKTQINEDLKNVLQPDDYKTNYGCHFTTIIKGIK